MNASSSPALVSTNPEIRFSAAERMVEETVSRTTVSAEASAMGAKAFK
jgi:hypothetical protein